MTTPTTDLRKPYITPYAEETVALPLTFVHVAGVDWLTYRDALPNESMFGVLWARCGTKRSGTVQWSLVHTLRQRRCMLKGLCRVCGRPAADPETGRLWWVMVSAPVVDDPTPWQTVGPPICQEHVAEALTACPRLRHGRRSSARSATTPRSGCWPTCTAVATGAR